MRSPLSFYLNKCPDLPASYTDDYSAESIISYIHVKELRANGLCDIAGVNSVSGGTLYLNPLPSECDNAGRVKIHRFARVWGNKPDR